MNGELPVAPLLFQRFSGFGNSSSRQCGAQKVHISLVPLKVARHHPKMTQADFEYGQGLAGQYLGKMIRRIRIEGPLHSPLGNTEEGLFQDVNQNGCTTEGTGHSERTSRAPHAPHTSCLESPPRQPEGPRNSIQS